MVRSQPVQFIEEKLDICRFTDKRQVDGVGMLDDELILIDEVLTPDSSRFWPADEYETGISPPSFDKQFVRDWLDSTGWDKNPPAPAMADEIVEKTADKYREAYRRITGTAWS